MRCECAACCLSPPSLLVLAWLCCGLLDLLALLPFRLSLLGLIRPVTSTRVLLALVDESSAAVVSG